MCLVVNVHFYTLKIFERRQLRGKRVFLASGKEGRHENRIVGGGGRDNVTFLMLIHSVGWPVACASGVYIYYVDL